MKASVQASTPVDGVAGRLLHSGLKRLCRVQGRVQGEPIQWVAPFRQSLCSCTPQLLGPVPLEC